MSTVLPVSTRARTAWSSFGEWWPIAIGLATLYVPTYISLITGIWSNDVNDDYGPVALLVIVFSAWQKRDIFTLSQGQQKPLLGGLSLTFGLILYIVGRSQDIAIFDLASQLPVLVGVLLLLRGWNAVFRLWFPLCFVFFMLPFPGVLVQEITGPLKQFDSIIVEHVLYMAGYPIGRNGVVLTIGPYQLMVADACSGLNSIFSLSAMGLLYIYYMHRMSWLHNGLLLAAVAPIAFIANVIRVTVLLLVTYYFGDSAGQGFTHGAASVLLFCVALMLLFAWDYLLGILLSRRSGPAARAS